MPAKKVSNKSNVAKTNKKNPTKHNRTGLIVFLAIFVIVGFALVLSAFASGGAPSPSVSKDPNVLCRRYFTRTPNVDDFSTVMSRLPVLRQGSSGTCVRTLQQQLEFKGYNLNIDGSFGPATRDAVIKFQQRRGLTQDGIVGRATWTALYR